MAKKKQSSKLGFDPLAWMKGGTGAPEKSTPRQTVNAPAATEKPGIEVKANEPPAKKPAVPARAAPIDETTIVCGAALGMNEVADLKQQLSAALDSGGSVRIDTSGVLTVQTAGLQLLVSFVQAADKKGVSVRWTDPSPCMVESARILGFTQVLRFAA